MGVELEQSLIRDKIESISEDLGVSASVAFLAMVHSLTTGQDWDSLDEGDITDGGDDLELDVIAIDELPDGEHAQVIIIAGTQTASHSTNELTRLETGLSYLLLAPKDEYTSLPNARLKAKILEFRQLRTQIGSSNIQIKCLFASTGNTEHLSQQFKLQADQIRTRFATRDCPFNLTILGARELADLLLEAESSQRKINERLRIDYDVNRGSIIERTYPGVEGAICSVKAEEIARLVNSNDNIFGLNLRNYLGSGILVNKEIYDTCTDPEQARLFWFLNNGITILCDRFTITKQGVDDESFLAIENLHIVNGCQTSSAIAEAARDGLLSKEASVLVRVFRAASQELGSRVVVTTNTQSKIVGRDLRSTDTIQKLIQESFKARFGLFYERKRNEFSRLNREDKKKVISNEKVGQAYLSVVLRRPSDGSRRKYRLWGDESALVFNTHTPPEAYLMPFLIVEICKGWRSRNHALYEESEISRPVLSGGIYHISRIVSVMYRRSDDWGDQSNLRHECESLRQNPEQIFPFIASAIKLLESLIENDPKRKGDVSGTLKTSEFDRIITAALHSGPTKIC